MEALVFFSYVLFGLGIFLANHPKQDTIWVWNIFEVLLWPHILGVSVMAALRKYLEL